VDPTAGLDDVEKRKFLTLPGLELRPLGRRARSQSLYRLSYPGSFMYGVHERSRLPLLRISAAENRNFPVTSIGNLQYRISVICEKGLLDAR
jgi:hypothetical protein